MVALAAAQGALLVAAPSPALIALGLWWNSNTISHNFVHRPFFRGRWANRLFAAYLSALLGVPQALWRERHLAHHAGVAPRLRFSFELALQVALVLGLWAALAAWNSAFFVAVYAPGYLFGLGLCWLHGYYEHARGATSHYGRLYNLLLFNDGFHVEHHASPGLHWTALRGTRDRQTRASMWPPPLRWIEAFNLESLERLALRSPALQGFLVRTHARAIRQLLACVGPVRNVVIVGGGLFPRTALALKEVLPEARITILDANRANLERARARLARPDIEFVHARYTGCDVQQYDLVVIPLSFEGDRPALYAHPPAAAVLVHDWIWRRRGAGRIVSLFLLKRVNLIRR
jgi:hypothetical protein